ncbi:hypothetical protein SLS59_007358 [Nothophoma quercina]|uniref:Uncharacterized protein n=1 Tax=Nothophoma quercina TaxID=749835 RepID=A0ABR3QZR7_9PLEO
MDYNMEDDELSIKSEDREETVRGDTDGDDDGEFNATVIELSDDEFDDKDPDVVRNCNLYMNQALKEMRWEGVQEDIDATWADIARRKAETKEFAKRQKESELTTEELLDRATVIISQRESQAMSSPANSTRSKRSASAEYDQRAKKKNSIPQLRNAASEQSAGQPQPLSLSRLSLTTSDSTRGRPRPSMSGVVRPPSRSNVPSPLAQRGRRGSSSNPSSYASRAALKPNLTVGSFLQQFDQAGEPMDVDDEVVSPGEQKEYSGNEDDSYGMRYRESTPELPPPELLRTIPSPESQPLKPANSQLVDASDLSDTGSDTRRMRTGYLYERLRKPTSNLNLTPIREVPAGLGYIPDLRPTGPRTQYQEQGQLQHRMPSNPNLTGNLTTGQETMAGAYPNSGYNTGYNTGYDRRDQFYGAPTGQNFASGPEQATSGFGGQHYGQAYPSPSRGLSPVRPPPMSALGLAAQASVSSLNRSAQDQPEQQGQAEQSPYDMHPGFGPSPIRSPPMAATVFGGQNQDPARLSFTSGSAYPQPSPIHARPSVEQFVVQPEPVMTHYNTAGGQGGQAPQVYTKPSVEQFGAYGAMPRLEPVMTYYSTAAGGQGGQAPQVYTGPSTEQSVVRPEPVMTHYSTAAGGQGGQAHQVYTEPSAELSAEQLGTHGAVARPETVMTHHSTVTSGLGTLRTGGEDTASATNKKSKRSKSPTKAAVGAVVPDSFAWDTTRGWVDLTGLEEGARKAMLDHSADLATNDRFLQYYHKPGREFDALCFGCRTVHRNAKYCEEEAGKKPGELKEACEFCCDTGTQPCGVLIPHPQPVFGGARHAIGYVPLPSSKRDPATSWNQYDFWVTSLAEKDRPSRPAKARKSKSFGASLKDAAQSAIEEVRRSTRHQKT